MDRLPSAVVGGVVGTAVLSLLLLLFDVQTRSALGIFAAIARFVGLPGQLALGFVLFALVGILVWPVLFLVLFEYLPRPDPAASGVVFAVPLWGAFVVIGRGDLVGVPLLIYAGGTLLAHLTYGFTVGAVTDYLAEGDV